MRNALEKSRSFPYLAWTAVIGLSLLTYYMTISLNKDLEHINSQKEVKASLLQEHDIETTPLPY